MDFAVLASNDWERFRPNLLVVELLETKLQDFSTSDIFKFLSAQNYSLTAKLFNSAIFVADPL
jgi:hypothetical protein